jgi:predicted ATPase
LRDLGEHSLKDLKQPEHIFQAIFAGLPSTFPPLRSLDARPNNLPTEATHFIGREMEVGAICQLLLQPHSPVRLITLTGPGGTGKTRLGLQVVKALLERADSFRDGLFFVALAPISEPTLVAASIAQIIGVTSRASQPVVESLRDYLRDKQMLLLLDNFEQVMQAAPLIGEVLSASPKLKMLVTSREMLHLYGEKEFPVPPLRLPDPRHLPPLEQLIQYEAVALFIERALLVQPDFAVTNDNAPAVAEICYRLDGLPLAIELAAARVKLLPPGVMLQRLQSHVLSGRDGRLKVLTGGARDLPARQQTLRGAIEWSHDLLGEEEKRLLRRLSVFVGGCTIEAAEAVCNPTGDVEDVLDTISSLLDKSLLKRQDEASQYPSGELRFGMLETIREYALERLEESGEAQEIRQRHAEFYLAFCEEAEHYLYAPQHLMWLDRLEAEQGNIRTALRWLIAQGDAQTALRLSAAVAPLWTMRGYVSEARTWFDEVLALPGASERTSARAKGLSSAASIAWPQGDLEKARVWSEESAAVFRELGDRLSLASALTILAVSTYLLGNSTAAGPIFEEATALSEESGQRRYFALLMLARAQMAMGQGDYPLARTRLQIALAEYKTTRSRWDTAQALNSLGDLARLEGKYDEAEQFYGESLALFREINAKGDIPASLHNLGHVALRRGDYKRARALFEESLALHRELGNNLGIAESLAGFAGVEAVESQVAAGSVEEGEMGQSRKALRAARLFGAYDALRGATDAPLWPAERADYSRNVAIVRAQVDEAAWERAWQEGQAMSMEQAIEYALQSG